MVSARSWSRAVLGLAGVVLAAAYSGCSAEDGGSKLRGSSAGDSGAGGDGADSGTGTGGASGTFATGGSGLIGLDDSGAGGSGGLDPDSGCGFDKLTSNLQPANLLFVIDKSGSMNCNLPEDGQTTEHCEQSSGLKLDPLQQSKWDKTRPLLSAALVKLQTEGNVSVGISMFPTDNKCGVKVAPDVAIQPLDDAHRLGIDAFLGTVGPIGSTPIAGATILAFEHLRQEIVSGRLVGNHFVVLMSDGAESCSVPSLADLIATQMKNAKDHFNIRTFVIGVPGSEGARATLSQIAWEGGTARNASCRHDAAPLTSGDCHFDMTTSTDFATDLAAALALISGEALSCELDVPASSSGSLDLLNVDVDGTRMPWNGRGSDAAACAAGANGWQFTPDRTKIVLCGDACTTAQSAEEILIVLGCPPHVIG